MPWGDARGPESNDEQPLTGGDARRPTIGLEEIRDNATRLVGLSPEVEAERAGTKEFLYRNLYYSPALQPEKEDAERVITNCSICG